MKQIGDGHRHPARVSVYEDLLEEYRNALSDLSQSFERVGFRSNAAGQGNGLVSVRHGDLGLDVTIQDTQHVVYFVAQQGKAKGARLDSDTSARHALQIILNIRGWTKLPVFVELPLHCADPRRFIFVSVFNNLKMLLAQDAALERLLDTLGRTEPLLLEDGL